MSEKKSPSATTDSKTGSSNMAMSGQLRERSRVGVVVALVASLALSVAARQWSTAARARPNEVPVAGAASASGASIGRFDSYALALLLGGLRGPLVMVLWTTSEQQKSERNLDDFDTKVEWIRLLQPEFDSVHIFQIWNKAYNISVQMASLSNKYATILDAVDYGMSVDAERPNNINVLAAVAQVWFEKLGQSTEKVYYRGRVRQESFAPAGTAKITTRRGDPGWRRTTLDPMLDANGMILPKYLKPTLQTGGSAQLSPKLNVEEIDGSELQFLAEWQPFPQGLSPLAVGYNYYKRAQVLQTAGKQRHMQLSDLVIDSRPALSLKIWAEEEWERGRRFELQAYGLKGGIERTTVEMPTAGVGVATTVVDPTALDAALYCYQRQASLGTASLKEYDRHLAGFKSSLNTYRAHIDLLTAIVASAEGDRDFILAVKASGAEREKLLASAKASYIKAREWFALSALRYYSDDEVVKLVLPDVESRFTLAVDPARPSRLALAALQSHELQSQHPDRDQYAEDRTEYIAYVLRLTQRLSTMGVR